MKKNLNSILSNYKVGTVKLNVHVLNSFIYDGIKKSKLNKKYTLLDIGCGSDSLIRYNKDVYKVGYDGHKKTIELAEKKNTHDEFVFGTFDELKDNLKDRKFDFIIAIDFIEHLKKEDGYKLLEYIETKANVGIALFTPNGFLKQSNLEKNDLMEHLSGWTKNEFEQKGYNVSGATGLKILRKEFHRIKYKPIIFWTIVSYFSQIIFTKYLPNFAAAIWALKYVNKRK